MFAFSSVSRELQKDPWLVGMNLWSLAENEVCVSENWDPIKNYLGFHT